MAGVGNPKGVGRKPGVPNKVNVELKELAQQYTSKAIDALVVIVDNPTHPAQVAAAKELLDRGHGKAPQSVMAEVTHSGKIQLEFVNDWRDRE